MVSQKMKINAVECLQRHLFKIFYLSVIFSILSLIGGCSTLSSNSFNPSVSWQNRYHTLNLIDQWTLRGSIAFHSPKKSFSAHLYWQQKNKNDYQLMLLGPLGMNTVQITGQRGLFTLKTSSTSITATSPEQLVFRQLGWKIPLSNLDYWIRGIPSPLGTCVLSWDNYHHLQTLQQAGWQIHYLKYQTIGSVDLPTKIILHNHFISLHIAIYSWEPL